MRFAETHLKVPEGANVGAPLRFEGFQEQFITSILDNPAGTRRAYLSVARKNGKSAVVACILLSFLAGPEAKKNTQIVSGAMSREQASLIFNLAVKMIQQSPELSQVVKIIPSGKRLIGMTLNVEYRALAADGATAQGLSVYLGLLDEVGQIRGPRSDFVDAITTSQGAHESPLLIALSTQAATDADMLSVWLDDAERSKDPHIVSHVYEAPKDCDLLDKEAWRAANPALGTFRSKKDLEEQMNQATRMPSAENSARNLLLNQRVSTVSPFVSKSVWESCGEQPGDLTGMKVYGGLDLSARTDLTSLVLCGTDSEGARHVQAYFWTPEQGIHERSKRDRSPYDVWAREGFLRTTPGATVDYGFVAAEMGEILADLDVELIGFDRWRIDVFRKELETLGLDFPMIEFGQGFKDMSPAIDALESDLLNGRLRHGMHPVLTMCAANAVVTKDPANNRKLDKHKATGRIDGMVSLAMALGVAGSHEGDGIDLDSFLSDPLVL